MYSPKPAFPILNRSNPLTVGIISTYPFFEGGGPTLTDLGTSRYNGTLTNTPLWKTDTPGKNLDFIGASSQYVDVGTYGNLGTNLGNPLSFSCALKTTQSTQGTIIGSVNTGTNLLWQIMINFDSVGVTNNQFLCVQYRNTGATKNIRGGTTSATNPLFNDGKWHFLTFTMDPATPLFKIYVDGVDNPVTMGLADVNFTESSNFANSLVLSARNNRAVIDNFVTGDIAYATFWNRVLSPQEAKSLAVNPWQIYQLAPRVRSINTLVASTTSNAVRMTMGMGT